MKTIKLFTLALFCAALQTVSAQDMAAKAKMNIQSAYDALNRRDWAGFKALCADNYTDLNVGPAPVTGIDACIGLYQQFMTAFPDLKFQIREIVPSTMTHTWIVRLTLTGTNTGPFMMLPPTGKSIRYDDVDFVVIDPVNGKCVSHAATNPGEALRQIGYGSLTNPNTAVVMDVYGKFGQGDIPGVLAMCTDNVVFDIQDRMFDSRARMFNGKAAVGQFFQELGAKFQYSKFQPTRFVADGDDVFVLVDAEYTHLPSGKRYASMYTHHFIVTNGKITFFRGVDDFQTMK